VKTALGQPGPPCRTSSTGLSRSSPRSWIHWSIPPTLTNRSSTIRLGVSIMSVLATRRWRALRQTRPPTAGAAMMPAAPPRMVPIMAAPQGSRRCLVLSGGSKRGPLQGLCPEPGSFPRSGVARRWLRAFCRERLSPLEASDQGALADQPGATNVQLWLRSFGGSTPMTACPGSSHQALPTHGSGCPGPSRTTPRTWSTDTVSHGNSTSHQVAPALA
jgi:hypothetical protein